MAVVIENMNLPDSCGFCRFCRGGNGSEAVHCTVILKYIADYIAPYDKRMEWCPMREKKDGE